MPRASKPALPVHPKLSDYTQAAQEFVRRGPHLETSIWLAPHGGTFVLRYNCRKGRPTPGAFMFAEASVPTAAAPGRDLRYGFTAVDILGAINTWLHWLDRVADGRETY